MKMFTMQGLCFTSMACWYVVEFVGMKLLGREAETAIHIVHFYIYLEMSTGWCAGNGQ